MSFENRDEYTICALATPHGVGGIHVIRVSGSHSLEITKKIAPFLDEKNTLQSHHCYFGSVRNPENSEIIDEVLVTYFKKGHSFTGEETCEISCHGSPQVSRDILKALIFSGAHVAERGEFTYRAFMNGKMDLIQAESVLALIESQSPTSRRQALDQLKGNLSGKIGELENSIIWCLAHLEAGIDFSTEGIELVSSQALAERLNKIISEIKVLVESYRVGRLLKDGFRLVLNGSPNVGKSSLLNLISQEERAIVTAVPGTTRDTIEASILLDGVKVTLVDTAGLRESEDIVEKIGIQKSRSLRSEADAIFFVYDCSKGLSEEELSELVTFPLHKTVLVGNKKDQTSSTEANLLDQLVASLEQSKIFQKNVPSANLNTLAKKSIFVSALAPESDIQIRSVIKSFIDSVQFHDQTLVSQARHHENLSQALKTCQQALQLVQAQASPELIALELKETLIKVQETLGKVFDDQVMDRVFKEFCIGK